jgi:hypothetical protein
MVNRDSSVGIAAGCGLDEQRAEVRVPVESRILYSPRCPDRPCGSPSVLSSGYGSLFPLG